MNKLSSQRRRARNQFQETLRTAVRGRTALFEMLEPRHLLAGDWNNPLVNVDVDDDGFVAPNDALRLINEVNLVGSRALPSTWDGSAYLDPTGDSFIAPDDALQVINWLNIPPPALNVSLGLSADSGSSATDGVTNDGRLQGALSASGNSPTVRFRINQGPVQTLTPNGAGQFLIDPAAWGVSGDGTFNVRVFASNALGAGGLKRFEYQLDTQAPSLVDPALRSADDSGTSDRDGITNVNQPRITFSTEAGAHLVARANGNVVFDEPAGGTHEVQLPALADGAVTLAVTASDLAGNTATKNLSLVIDTAIARALTFDLAPTSDSGTPGDQATRDARVTLTGATEGNAFVSVVGPGDTVRTAGDGSFRIPNLSLALGGNNLQLRVTDLAGNVGTLSRTITRSNEAAASDPVLRWVQANLDAIVLDATTPQMASRGMAMVSIAMLDVVNAVEKTPGYLVALPAPAGISIDAAISTAARTVMDYLFPGQTSQTSAVQAAALAQIPDGVAKTQGIDFGRLVGEAVIALRDRDGWDTFVDYVPGTAPGQWRETAPMYDVALLPQWGDVTPFGVADVAALVPDGPPELTSQEWADAYNEVKTLGSATGSSRTADQTQIARFWADGGGTYTPPGHWGKIAAEIAVEQGLSVGENARLFAALNVALGDAAIVAWRAKFDTDFWRPITAIANADLDGNPLTAADLNWSPLLITPPFPEYVSGHSTFSGAAAQVLTDYFGDNVAFSTMSLGLPGITRNFTSFDEAATEASMSRIYGGIHYRFSGEDGLATGRAVADEVLARFSVKDDTLPPSIVFLAPPQGSVMAANPTIQGWTIDNLAGVASATAQVDNGPLVALTLDANGRFSFTPSLPTNGSADGPHVVHFRATDLAGFTSDNFDFTFTLDTVAPQLTILSPADNANITGAATLAGSVGGTGSNVVSLTYQIDAGAAVPIPFTNGGGDFTRALDLSRVTLGGHDLTIRAEDAAGLVTSRTLHFTMTAAAPLNVASHEPLDGADEVGTMFRPQVVFSRPVNPATLNANNFFATNGAGEKLPATIVPAQDGSFAWLFFTNSMPGGTTVSVHVDGETILASDGTKLDADGNGVAGGELVFRFTTVGLVPLEGTSLSGRVVDPGDDLKPMTFDDIRSGPDGVLHTADDVFLSPIAHAKVFILGLEEQFVYTDANGWFSFASVPAGNIKLAIDGRTATNSPTGTYWPEMVMDLEMVVGQANTVMGTMGTAAERAANLMRDEVYLPRLENSILTPIAPTGVTTVTVDGKSAPNLTPEQRQYLKLEVQAGSVIGPDGQPLANPQVGISTVPPSLVRDMLPPGLLQHTFDITIQAPGAVAFNPPARLTFPNLFGAEPGSQVQFLSFDHTTGRLVFEGTATVSQDGKSITTDPGIGITKPGWHGGPPPGTETDPPKPPPDPCKGWSSDDTWAMASALAQALKQVTNFGGIIKTGLDAVSAVNSLRDSVTKLRADWQAGELSREGVIAGLQALNATKNFAKSAYDNFTSKNPLTTLGRSISAAIKVANAALERVGSRGSDCLGLGGQVIVNVAREILTFADRVLDNATELETKLRNAPLTATCLVFDALLAQVSNLPANGEGEGEGPISDAELLAGLDDIIAESQNFVLNNQPVLSAIDEDTDDLQEQLNVMDVGSVSPLVVGGAAPNAFWRATVGALQVTGRTNSSGRIDPPPYLPPETPYVFEIFDPAHNVVLSTSGITAISGERTQLGSFQMQTLDGATDTDGEGLADLAEGIIGTSIVRIDTDQDGLPDLVEVLQGLDPLGGLLLPTGIVASVPLLGEAMGVVIAGAATSGAGMTAYLATGEHGLAIVNVTQFQQPLVLSQLDLPGLSRDVAIDEQLQVAVVATSQGLRIVDVANPAAPVVRQTIGGGFTAVEVLDGIAYAATGTGLRSFDLLSGERIAVASLAGGGVSDLELEGTRLYARYAGGGMQIVDVASGQFTLRGGEIVPEGGGEGRLFVGGELAIYGVDQNGFSGFATVDVSDPDAPEILSMPDATNFAGRHVVANGSGLAIGVGETLVGTSLVRSLDVFDISDPENTAAFLTRYPLPEAPKAVALGAGLAFVADGLGGLKIVNYRSLDSLGIAPTVTASLLTEDLDLDTDGIQIQEGQIVDLSSLVTDDVQVRNVELLLNDQVVANDLAFPFRLSTVLPTILANGSDVVTLRVRATDTGGNVGLSAPVDVQLVPDTFGPTLINTNVADGSRRGFGFRAATFTFSEPIDPSTVNAETFTLDGPSGPVALTNVQLRSQDRTVQITFDPLELGNHTLVVHAAQVTDVAGNVLGASDLTFHFEVTAYTAAWINVAGGDWDNPANWESGVLPGPDDDVLISLAGGGTVTIPYGDFAIRSLLSTQPLELAGGYLNVAESLRVDNQFVLSAGALLDATLEQGEGDASVIVPDGGYATLENVVLGADVTLLPGATLAAAVSLTLDDATITLSHPEGESGYNWLEFVNLEEIGGRGTIVLEANSSGYEGVLYGYELTIHPEIVVRGQAYLDFERLVNEGTLLADRPDGSLYVDTDQFENRGLVKSENGGRIDLAYGLWNTADGLVLADGGNVSMNGPWVNEGTIRARNGATLDLNSYYYYWQDSTWTNLGLIDAADSVVNLGGVFSQQTLGNFQRSGGVVNIVGELNNRGALDAVVLKPEGGAVTAFVPSDGSVDNSWYLPDFDDSGWTSGNGVVGFDRTNGVDPSPLDPFIGLDIESAMADQSSTAYLRMPFMVDDPLELGGLQLLMRFNDGFVAYLNGVEIMSYNAYDGRGWEAESDYPNDFLNVETFEISSFSYLLHAGENLLAIQLLDYPYDEVPSAALGAELTAGLRSDDVPLHLDATTGSWNLAGGTIVGGRISTADGAHLNVSTNAYGMFIDVTLATDLVVSDWSLEIYERLTLDNATVTFRSPDDDYSSSFGQFLYNVLVDGAGEFVMERNNLDYVPVLSGDQLTIGPDVTIHGEGTFDVSSLENHGEITADVDGATLYIFADEVRNWGTLQAINGATLYVSNLSNKPTGLVSANAATLTFDGAFRNAGSINATDSTTNLGGSFTGDDLGDFQRQGGTVNLTGTLDNRGPLDAVTLKALTGPVKVFVPSDGALGDSWIAPDFDDSAWLSGNGIVGYDRTNGDDPSPYDALIGLDIETSMADVNDTAYLRMPFTVTDPLELGGLLLRLQYDDAFVLYLNGERVLSVNDYWGTDWDSATEYGHNAELPEEFEISDYAHLLRAGTNVLAVHLLDFSEDDDDALLGVELVAGLKSDDDTLALNAATGSWVLAGGNILGGVISLTGGATLDVSPSNGILNDVTLASDLLVGNSSLNIRNGLTLANANLLLSPSDDVYGGSNLYLLNPSTIDGSGQIVMGENNLGYQASIGGAPLILDDGITLHGSGDVSVETLLNRGTIRADVNEKDLAVYAQPVVNEGQMEAVAGGILIVSNLTNSAGSTVSSNASMLALYGAWTNAGSISGTNGSTLDLGNSDNPWSNPGTISVTDSTTRLGGYFSGADLGVFQRSGGTVSLTGTLDNRGALDAVTLKTMSGPVRVFVPTDDSLGDAWIAPNFDDSTWTSGNGIVGYDRRNDPDPSPYDALIGLDIESSMADVNDTAYLRMPFTVTDPMQLGGLVLRLRYDDAFVLYLNGVRVTSDGDYWGNNWDSGTEYGHDGESIEEFDLSDFVHLLQPGTNVLAFHLLDHIDSEVAALLGAELVAGLRSDDATLALNATTGSWILDAGTILGGTISTSGGAELVMFHTTGTFDGVTLANDLTVANSSLALRNRLTLSSGAQLMVKSADDEYAHSYVYLDSRTLVDGDGQMVLANNNLGYSAQVYGNELVLGADVTLRGAGSVTALPFTNQGTVLADIPGESLRLEQGSMANEGTMSATSQGTLYVQGLSNHVGGQVTADDGHVELSANWTNAGAMAIVNGSSLTIMEPTSVWTNTGTISSTNSTTNLGGQWTLAALGNFTRVGGDVNVTGSLDLRGELHAVTLKSLTSPVRVLVPTDGSLGDDWFEPTFDDSAWTSGAGIVGYDRRNPSPYDGLIGLDIESSMADANDTAYLRMPFEVTDPSQLGGLVLRLRYDDGYIAYLNGVQVSAANNYWGNDWDAGTGYSHDGEVLESIDLSEFQYLLHPGTNLLAFHLLDNFDDADEAALLGAELVAGVKSDDDALALNATTGTWNLAGGTILGGVISTSGGAQFEVTQYYGRLDGVTLASDVTLANQVLEIRNDLVLAGGATLSVTPADDTYGDSTLSLLHPLTIAGTGQVLLSRSNFGYQGTLNGTELTIASGITLAGEGSVYGNVTNLGTLRADVLGGSLYISGNLASSGTIGVVLGGTQSSEFAQLSVSGELQLAGEFDIATTNGFVPQTGDTFTALTFGTSAGAFATVEGHGFDFDLHYNTNDITIESVDPLLPAAGSPSSGAAAALTTSALETVVSAAMQQLAAWGLTDRQLAQLAALRISIVDLDATGQLAHQTSGQIRIDDDGAGAGWFVDATPNDDDEFAAGGGTSRAALASGPAAGKFDLLTVVLHELCHELGLEHSSAQDDLMYESLAVGQRKTLSAEDVDQLFGD